MSQVKIRIPKRTSEGGDIVGILQRTSPNESTRGKRVALLIHGILSHKNQSFHPGLASKLSTELKIDSFRYDLTGQGGETEGKFDMANFDDDVDDLERVIEYLREEFGYLIHVRTYLVSYRAMRPEKATRPETDWHSLPQSLVILEDPSSLRITFPLGSTFRYHSSSTSAVDCT